MDTLSTSNFNIRTIELRDLHQLVSDLNFNFKQIMQLPGFKGVTGAAGASVTGATGPRGSLWSFANATAFLAAYPALSSSSLVTMQFLNLQLTTNLPLLLTTLGLTSLADNDVVVLPNRDVIQYDSITNTFSATGIQFADGFSMTAEEVTTIVNNILGSQTNVDVFTSFKGHAKNYSDVSTGLNVELNQNSVVDVEVIGSVPGVYTADHVFIAMKEAISSNTKQFMFLTGSAKRYHELVQQTQSELTNDFMPGIDDFGALAVMQNSYNNGIIMGHKDDTTFANWSRMYRTQNVLRILSDYHPTLAAAARLDLGKTGSTLYSPANLMLSIGSGIFTLNDAANNTNWIQASNGSMSLGHNSLNSLYLGTSGFIRVQTAIGNNAPILSLQGGYLKGSAYQPHSAAIMNDPFLLVTHNLIHDFVIATNIAIANLTTRVEDLEAARVYKQQGFLTSASANTLTEFGFYKLWRQDATSVFTSMPDNRLQTGVVGEAYIEVHRFYEPAIPVSDSHVTVKQIYTTSGTVGGSEQFIRTGYSGNNGATFAFGDWTAIVDSTNYRIIAGDKIVSTVNYDSNKILTISHMANAVGAIGDWTLPYTVIKAVNMDAGGHPQSAATLDINAHFYTKAEVDAQVAMHSPIDRIEMWAGLPATIPFGWRLCDGTNGTPNLKGRFIVGYDPADADYNNFTSDATRSGGIKRLTLTLPNVPSHRHEYKDIYHAESGGYVPLPSNWGSHGGSDTDNGGWDFIRPSGYTGGVGSTYTAAGTTTPFDTRSPYYTLCFIQYKGPSAISHAVTVPDTIAITTIDDISGATSMNWSIVNNSGILYNTITLQRKLTSTVGWTSPYTIAHAVTTVSGTFVDNASLVSGNSYTYRLLATSTASGSPTITSPERNVFVAPIDEIKLNSVTDQTGGMIGRLAWSFINATGMFNYTQLKLQSKRSDVLHWNSPETTTTVLALTSTSGLNNKTVTGTSGMTYTFRVIAYDPIEDVSVISNERTIAIFNT